MGSRITREGKIETTRINKNDKVRFGFPQTAPHVSPGSNDSRQTSEDLEDASHRELSLINAELDAGGGHRLPPHSHDGGGAVPKGPTAAMTIDRGRFGRTGSLP